MKEVYCGSYFNILLLLFLNYQIDSREGPKKVGVIHFELAKFLKPT